MYKAKKFLTLSIISASLLMAGCSEASKTDVEKSIDAQSSKKQQSAEQVIERAMRNPTVVEIGSLDDLFNWRCSC